MATFAQFRHDALVAVTKPAWLVYCSMLSACMLLSVRDGLIDRKAWREAGMDVANVGVYLALLSMPFAALASRSRSSWHGFSLLQAATVVSHAGRSLLMCCAAAGLAPVPEAIMVVLKSRTELMPVELQLGVQDQLSLPVMVILHAFRQVAWMSIVVGRLDGDPYRCLLRGLWNWVCMVLVTCCFEMRTWAAYQRFCHAQQAQQQQQYSLSEVDAEFISHLPSPDKPVSRDNSREGGSDKSSGQAKATAALAALTPAAAAAATAAAAAAAASVVAVPASAAAAPVTAAPALAVAEPAAAAAAPAVAIPAATAAAPAAAGAAAVVAAGAAAVVAATASTLPRKSIGNSSYDGPVLACGTLFAPDTHTSVQPAAANNSLCACPNAGTAVQAAAVCLPRQQPLAAEVLRVVEQQHRQPYRRARGQTTVHVKMNGIELEQMPADLPRLLQEQMQHCMPGVTMAGLALRSGCVMMAIEIMSNEDDFSLVDSPLAGGMSNLISQFMQGHSMGRMLEKGATMNIQVEDQLSGYIWHGNHYSDLDVSGLTLGPAGPSSCRMLSALPIVCYLPDSDAAIVPARHQLSLTVELQLPSNCQLHGWLPADAAVPAAVGGLLPSAAQEGVGFDAMLLARRLDGGYLPVTVEVLHLRSAKAAKQDVTARVMITLEDAEPGAVRLELWRKEHAAAGVTPLNQLNFLPVCDSFTQPDGSMIGCTIPEKPGLELLVAHMPLLVLPRSWKEAASELQQHIQDMGGVQPRQVLPARGINDSAESLCWTSDSAPSDTQTSGPTDAALSWLMEDLGLWLSHHSQAAKHLSRSQAAAATASQQALAVSASMMSELGDSLLLYAVRQGLKAVAGMTVDVMEKDDAMHCQMRVPCGGSFVAVHHDAAPEPAGDATLASGWLLRVAHASGTTASLLHAAMASGSSDMLALVFRWGTLYGGPEWAWPWELKDATGCTALHLAAAQPAADACAALLKTITCMLPASQVQAACNAWLHCRNVFGDTPAGVFAMTSAMDSLPWPWGDQHAGSTGPPSTAAASSRHPVPPTTAPSAPPACTMQPNSWLASVVEVWITPETVEYRAWAKKQMCGLVYFWAATMLFTAFMSSACSIRAGSWFIEIPHIVLPNLAYIPLAMATSGTTWLGDWQAWMLIVHVLHTGSYFTIYFVKTCFPGLIMAAWDSIMASGSDAVYVVLLTSSLDQALLRHWLVVEALETLCHGLVYKAAAYAHPWRHALIVHGMALVVTTLARARQLRAYQRWQAAQVARGTREPQPCTSG